jgi:hypothetical protein
MRLSTSSSSERVPLGGWLLTWLIALAVTATLLAGWEAFVRARGLGDVAVTDSAELWIGERERAAALGDDALVLVGASRMQGGLDLEVLRDATGLQPVQLAITGAPFMPVLRHLAADPAITGTVLVSMDMPALRILDDASRAELWTAAYDDFKSGRTAVFYQPLEDWLRAAVEGLLVSFSRNARPHQLILANTSASYVRTFPDRSQLFDYSKVDREAAYQRRLQLAGAGVTEPRFFEIIGIDDRFAEIVELVDVIQGRGGRVVFVRFPSAKRIREIEDIMYPRDAYWDLFVALTDAGSIHYADYPALEAFDLPDGVHLDASQRAPFTQALARILVAGGHATRP